MKSITTYARLGLGIAAGALALTSFAGSASADEPAATSGTDRTIASTLTSAERAQVNAEVAETMRKAPGGERIGLNQIAWPEKGAVMTIPLPGETRARAADKPIGSRDDGCDYGRVCLWEDEVLEGRSLEFYKCKFQKLRWYDFTNKTSSWVNNQTDGTKSTLYYWTGSKVRSMAQLTAWNYQYYVIPDNKADFLRVC
ncbi:peptidase inhibitor family I36 protein [Solicola gregarius]|uniref:Peptidase inhibitor family I36 protein n=1 Tax=Solicola gregarius TaxID=2908642 RepID=A0AA46TKH4_9ACTN|nr:peptidase inhibitor family I36 protein [Solicola gregarius]UYM06574.1 peptidase inhibitor family I36 protein [Solicola gregarius]